MRKTFVGPILNFCVRTWSKPAVRSSRTAFSECWSCATQHTRRSTKICNLILKTSQLHTGSLVAAKSKVQQVESRWLELLTRMATEDDTQSEMTNTEAVLSTSSDKVAQIRDLLSRAVRTKRSQQAGDLMPVAAAKETRHFYSSLQTQAEKLAFLLYLERDLGVNHKDVVSVSSSLDTAQDRGIAAVLRAEEKLRQALEPPYIQLLSHISRLQGGVKCIVDMRRDLLEILAGQTEAIVREELQSLSHSIKSLLAQWFAVGMVDLQRITWNSPCSILEKIIRYEAVHPIQGWDDLKRRLAPDRRCYIYTHRSMPGEPVVVLHTALEHKISNNIQVVLSEPEVDGEDYEFECGDRTTAVFYSISSTQKGLSGVDLGNFLIKHVVEELQHEFPSITDYSTLSPVPGFVQWLRIQLNGATSNEGKQEENQRLLQDDECEQLSNLGSSEGISPLNIFKKLVETGDWHQNHETAKSLKKPLLRLCARYLYSEKRRGFAMDPVANFHTRNGACMWRLNWLADTSDRGLRQSCGMMVNYKYILQDVDRNNQQYLVNGTIASAPQFLNLLGSS